jgi:hypothetical protein
VWLHYLLIGCFGLSGFHGISIIRHFGLSGSGAIILCRVYTKLERHVNWDAIKIAWESSRDSLRYIELNNRKQSYNDGDSFLRVWYSLYRYMRLQLKHSSRRCIILLPNRESQPTHRAELCSPMVTSHSMIFRGSTLILSLLPHLVNGLCSVTPTRVVTSITLPEGLLLVSFEWASDSPISECNLQPDRIYSGLCAQVLSIRDYYGDQHVKPWWNHLHHRTCLFYSSPKSQ